MQSEREQTLACECITVSVRRILGGVFERSSDGSIFEFESSRSGSKVNAGTSPFIPLGCPVEFLTLSLERSSGSDW